MTINPHANRQNASLAAIFFGLTTALFGHSSLAQAASLEVIVSNLSSGTGNVHIALYDQPSRFLDSDGMISNIETPISGHSARHLFTGLPLGRYAIAVYHDENDNDNFDQGFLGIPLEDYAFSNNAEAFLGPPSFEAAAFNLSGNQHLIIPITD